MSEWTSVVAVYWALWALDGARLAARRGFTIVGGGVARRGRISQGRLSLPGLLPGSWRMVATDVPMSLSPVGIVNVPIGSAGRPAETPPRVQAWRWEEVREVGVAKGWIFINGARFCADTGHVSARELFALAQLGAGARDRRIRYLIGRWFRPAHLRRRAKVLTARTPWIESSNMFALIATAAMSVYAAGELSERVTPRTSHAIANALPWLILGVLTAHLAAVIMAWRTVKRLKSVTGEKRGTALFSALLMPPQALRLRALLGEGFFPPQHPLAAVMAFGGKRAKERAAFDTLADLRWPLPVPEQTALGREVAGWFRGVIEPLIDGLVKDAGMSAKALLAAPKQDSPMSCSYCPRCGDQFVEGMQMCPHGVKLVGFAEASASRGGEGNGK